MVLDCVLQLLQEGQIRGLPWAQTFFILGVWQRVRDVSGKELESTGGSGAMSQEAWMQRPGQLVRRLIDQAGPSLHPPRTALPCPGSTLSLGPLWTCLRKWGREQQPPTQPST